MKQGGTACQECSWLWDLSVLPDLSQHTGKPLQHSTTGQQENAELILFFCCRGCGEGDTKGSVNGGREWEAERTKVVDVFFC